MLWDRDELAALRGFSCDPLQVRYVLSANRHTEIEQWTVRFPLADPDRLLNETIKATYTNKPLVKPFDQPLFGELAIVRCLERDGWSAVWVDTFHGAELFWRDMPTKESPMDLGTESEVMRLYRGLVAENGKRGGFFDVLAWRDSEYLFIEFKGKGDKPNKNERSWVNAALRYGIQASQLLFAEYEPRKTG
jgi:hypothetical protein